MCRVGARNSSVWIVTCKGWNTDYSTPCNNWNAGVIPPPQKKKYICQVNGKYAYYVIRRAFTVVDSRLAPSAGRVKQNVA